MLFVEPRLDLNHEALVVERLNRSPQDRGLDVAELPVLESVRTEIARVTTLGLAGFDLDDPRDMVREAAASLEGMRSIAEAEASAESSASVSRDPCVSSRPHRHILAGRPAG